MGSYASSQKPDNVQGLSLSLSVFICFRGGPIDWLFVFFNLHALLLLNKFFIFFPVSPINYLDEFCFFTSYFLFWLKYMPMCLCTFFFLCLNYVSIYL
uniref:Uncharacterized protein n=1 Tax=Nelumbo nucifera TaxID=4432 RepID=A0A822YYK2_NELNU|nr:TPA_asm: hypothetical protein HUJ06_008258 [Nelumbo nucifera]